MGENGINLRYIRNYKERSAAIARNIGGEDAKYDYLMFLDSDVILNKHYIEEIKKILSTNPQLIGVQGLVKLEPKVNERHYQIYRIFAKLFFLDSQSKNTCRFTEYPLTLTTPIYCEWLSGCNMTLKKEAFLIFKFDENLKKYSLGEDKILSYSLYRLNDKSLAITPYAKLIHKESLSGRMNPESLKSHIIEYRKYMLKKLFGNNGKILFIRQRIGLFILKILFNTWL